MAKRNEVYKCAECGNIVEVIVPTDKDVCGFKQLKENTTDAATEKHVPVVEKIEGGYRVTVGEVEHPMTEAHYIQFIELITDNNVPDGVYQYTPGTSVDGTYELF